MMHLVIIKILVSVLNNYNILRYQSFYLKKMDMVIKENCPAADNLEENGCASNSVCTFMSTHTNSLK